MVFSLLVSFFLFFPSYSTHSLFLFFVQNIVVLDENGFRINLLQSHNGRDGTFYGAPASLVGGGLAFPEVWCDPDGFVEGRVGFVKHYSRHLDRMISAMVSNHE